MSTIITEEKNEVRLYLLGQLGEAEEERVELRLLTDSSFGEEFDTVVDEITDQYVGNEFKGEERKRVEQYFLRAPQRQMKAHFAIELLQRAEHTRGNGHKPVSSSPGFIQALIAFWTKSFSMRLATTTATLLIVGVVAYFLISPNRGSGNYAMLNLQMNASVRGGGSQAQTVRLAGYDGVRIELTLPTQSSQTQSYRVELRDEQDRSKDLSITERTDRSLVVTIPADEISPGTYLIQLYADEQRLRGSYSFNVE